MIETPISDIISKDLRRWFKEKWVDVSRKDKDGKHPPCGRDEAKTDSKGYPKCRPSKKVSEDTPKTSRSMSQKTRRPLLGESGQNHRELEVSQQWLRVS